MKEYFKMLRRRSLRYILSTDIHSVTENNLISLFELIEVYLNSMPRFYRIGVNITLFAHAFIPPIALRHPELYSKIPLVSMVTKLVLAVALLRLFDEKDARLYSVEYK